MGKVSQTVSGESCRTWDVLGISDAWRKFPEYHFDHNYCRNPTNALDEPYCQRQSDGQNEKCNVPMCGEYHFRNVPATLFTYFSIWFCSLEESDWSSTAEFDNWNKQWSRITKDINQADGYKWTVADHADLAYPICQKDLSDCESLFEI